METQALTATRAAIVRELFLKQDPGLIDALVDTYADWMPLPPPPAAK